ncbi:MAG: gliding motility-associated C-terminal domain-containing protein [Ferruginibacter sp.]|nr:gliding motility-associated C-terminal domain-containing protein [Cytophagales bacterium]
MAPDADADSIRLRYVGASAVAVQNGQLTIRTSLNTVTETKPYCYQTVAGQVREVAARFDLADNQVTFGFPRGYARAHALVIDPVLVFATFSGSVSDNWGHCATYDAEDNLYSGGTAFGAGFPATNGAFQVRYSGVVDVAILKYNPTGNQLLYATYLGGEEGEVPHSLYVNKKGELLVLGTTSSRSFPVTPNGYDRLFNGGTELPKVGNTPSAVISGISYPNGSDLFVVKLVANGSQLAGSTYLGGSGNDGIRLEPTVIRNYGDQFRSELIADANDNVYVASVTASANFPVRNAGQSSYAGNLDAVVLRLNPDLSDLQWSTFFGGRGLDAAYSLRIGGDGSVYAAGVTTSDNLPTQPNAWQSAFAGGEDGFVVRFRNDRLVQATYLGTNAADQAMLLDLDPADNVHVLGLTLGTYPVSAGVYHNPGSRQFIHALDPSLSRTVFSTVIGSGRPTPDLSPTAFLVNECGNIYLSGWGGVINQQAGNPASSTRNLPVTPDAYRGATDGDDFYVMVLEKEARSFLYATFMGDPTPVTNGRGSHVDGGTSRFNKKGVIYHAICACGGSGFPTTPGAWSNLNRSENCNNAAFKFDIESLKADFDLFDSQNAKNVTTGCAPFALRFVNTSVGGITYEWDLGSLAKSGQSDQVSYTFNQPGEYVIVLKAFNRLTCQKEDTATRTIRVLPANFNVIGNQQVCKGASVQLKAEWGNRYVWTPATGLSNANVADPVATPTSTTRYRVTITNESGCTGEKDVLVTVTETRPDDFELLLSSECGKPVAVGFINHVEGADRFVWTMGNGDTLRAATPSTYVYPKSGTYEVAFTVFRGECAQTATKSIEIMNLADPPNVVTPNGDDKNETFLLALRDVTPPVGVDGYKLEIFNRWGKTVYQTDVYRNDWGPGVANGLYYYLLTSPAGIQCKGWVQVLR